MTSSLQIPYSVTSSIRPRNGSNPSLLSDDTFETYQTYDIKSEWASFPGGPQPNENADYLEYQALYNNCVQICEQAYNHASWVSEDQEDPAFNRGANLDASSTFKESSDEAPIQQGASNFGKSETQKNFVRKLYDMLDDKGAQKYIRWNPDGKSFVIDNQDDFAKNVLGRCLKTGNFQSFIRQLNMYNFHKTNKTLRAQRGVQAQAQQFVFSHSKFQRGKLELLSEIKRKGTEQQDPPPQYETVLSGARFGPSLAQGHLPLPSSQFDYQTRILLQAENERLRKENEQLKEELVSERNSPKAGLRVGTSVLMPQAQNEPSSTALTTHSTFLDGNTSNQSFDLTHNRNLFGFDYMGSPPKPVEGPIVFPQYTGATVQSTSNNQGPSIMNTPLIPLDSTSLPDPSTNAPSPRIRRTRQPSPQQSRCEGRPTSWGEWFYEHLPLVKSQDEAGPSNSVDAPPRDAHAVHNANYGKAPVGGRALPVQNSDEIDNFCAKMAGVSFAESTSLPSPSTIAPSPNIKRNRQPSPQQSRRKERPTLLGERPAGQLPFVGSQDEGGPPTGVNVFPQDVHAAHNANYGKAPFGGRAQPVMRVHGGSRT